MNWKSPNAWPPKRKRGAARKPSEQERRRLARRSNQKPLEDYAAMPDWPRALRSSR